MSYDTGIAEGGTEWLFLSDTVTGRCRLNLFGAEASRAIDWEGGEGLAGIIRGFAAKLRDSREAA